ncbi:MAG: hypothetical protein AAF590_12440 [Pseudomonadota bacterium]
MRWLATLLELRRPLAALALCALIAQQFVGVVLTASPVMAEASGFSICFTGEADRDLDVDGERDAHGFGFCSCTLQIAAGLLPLSLGASFYLDSEHLTPLRTAPDGVIHARAHGPAPARAPPGVPHT